eukprot:CAMPEP_0171202444 /NCGR_PEP_ID=MMETSP0790-20130122/25003_1 /TAXON_ID=2925 /ORGANISM="Alexandrium catenella, Strain OF101" /LENGTH=49 /DNA_ID= /DNA_START= /DNA_END= /DNA_ORIENTATION=
MTGCSLPPDVTAEAERVSHVDRALSLCTGGGVIWQCKPEGAPLMCKAGG